MDCEIIDLSQKITNMLPLTFKHQTEYEAAYFQLERGQSVGITFNTTKVSNFFLNHSTHIDFPHHVDGIRNCDFVGEYLLDKFVGEVVIYDARNLVERFIRDAKVDTVSKTLSINAQTNNAVYKAIFSAIENLEIKVEDFVRQVGDDISSKAVIIYTGLDAYWVTHAKEAWEYLYFFNPYVGHELAEFFVSKRVKIIGIDALQIENPIINFDESQYECEVRLSNYARTYIRDKQDYLRRHFAHEILLSEGIMLVENLANLGMLRDKGKALFCSVPLKFTSGTTKDNSVTRAFAIVLRRSENATAISD